jgi:hypothetical protein
MGLAQSAARRSIVQSVDVTAPVVVHANDAAVELVIAAGSTASATVGRRSGR